MRARQWSVAPVFPEATAYQVFRTVGSTPLLLATLSYQDTPPAGTAATTYRVVPVALDGTTGEGASVDWKP